MPFPNQQFYLKISSTYIGQSANIIGRLITVPSGTIITINTWTEITPGFYIHPLTLSSGEYIADITIPWDSNLYTFPIDVNNGTSSGTNMSYGSIIS